MGERKPSSQTENASLPEDLVSGLYTIIGKHGKPNPKEKTSEFQSGKIKIGERTIEFFLSADFDDSGKLELLWVSKSPGTSIEELGYMRTFDTEVGQLVWDTRLSIKDARQAVIQIQNKQNRG